MINYWTKPLNPIITRILKDHKKPSSSKIKLHYNIVYSVKGRRYCDVVFKILIENSLVLPIMVLAAIVIVEKIFLCWIYLFLENHLQNGWWKNGSLYYCHLDTHKFCCNINIIFSTVVGANLNLH